MLDSLLLQQIGEPLRFFDRSCSDQHWLPCGVQLLNFVRGGKILFFFRTIDEIRIFNSPHGAIGRNDGDIEAVDFAEFCGFRLGGTGHASKLLVHAEIILEGNGRECLVLALNLHAFFGFHGLMQAIGPAPAGH